MHFCYYKFISLNASRKIECIATSTAVIFFACFFAHTWSLAAQEHQREMHSYKKENKQSDNQADAQKQTSSKRRLTIKRLNNNAN